MTIIIIIIITNSHIKFPLNRRQAKSQSKSSEMERNDMLPKPLGFCQRLFKFVAEGVLRQNHKLVTLGQPSGDRLCRVPDASARNDGSFVKIEGDRSNEVALIGASTAPVDNLHGVVDTQGSVLENGYAIPKFRTLPVEDRVERKGMVEVHTKAGIEDKNDSKVVPTHGNHAVDKARDSVLASQAAYKNDPKVVPTQKLQENGYGVVGATSGIQTRAKRRKAVSMRVEEEAKDRENRGGVAIEIPPPVARENLNRGLNERCTDYITRKKEAMARSGTFNEPRGSK